MTFAPATAELARELAAHLRTPDRAEVLASGGYAPLPAALDAIEWSEPDTARAGFIDGELAAMLGVVRGSFVSGVAYPWLLTTDVVDRRPFAFLRACGPVLDGWLERWPVLEQRIDARYRAALAWAAWLGFQVEPPEPWGFAGLPFCRITLRRNDRV